MTGWRAATSALPTAPWLGGGAGREQGFERRVGVDVADGGFADGMDGPYMPIAMIAQLVESALPWFHPLPHAHLPLDSHHQRLHPGIIPE